MNKIWRVYTELKNKENIEAICSKYFESFHLSIITSYWMGEKEPMLVFEVVGTYDIRIQVLALMWDIKIANDQEKVLLTITPAEVMLV